MKIDRKAVLDVRRGAILGILALMVISFAIVLNPIHATTPSVLNTGHNSCVTCSQLTVNLAVTNVGDAIAIGWGFLTNSQDQYSTISSITGNNGEVFNAQGTQAGSCGPPTCASAGHLLWFGSAIWSATATVTGTLTFTVSWSYSPNTVGVEAYDIAGVPALPISVNSGNCNESGSDCPNTMTTAASNAFVSGNAIEIGSYLATQTLVGATPGTGYSLLGAGTNNVAGEYSATATSVPTPTNFPLTLPQACSHPCGWAVVGAIFGNTAVTSTTTINTMCIAACQSANKTTIFSITMPNSFVYQTSQNLATGALVDNFTMKVASVNINVVRANVTVLVYTASGAGLPSGGNPWLLQSSTNYPITNQSSNFFIHVNPQTPICSSCYYAVGIFTTTTGSRGQGATGTSGIAFYESSDPSIVQYRYAMGSSTAANSFYANTVVKPNLFMIIHTILAVGYLTSTITSTFTGTNVITSTTTTTSTSVVTTIDSTFFLQNANYPLIFLVLFLPTGLFLGITRNLAGGFVGMLMGAVILIVLIPSLSFLFTGLVIALVALAIVVQRSGGFSG
jgi:hypothetical protein